MLIHSLSPSVSPSRSWVIYRLLPCVSFSPEFYFYDCLANIAVVVVVVHSILSCSCLFARLLLPQSNVSCRASMTIRCVSRVYFNQFLFYCYYYDFTIRIRHTLTHCVRFGFTLSTTSTALQLHTHIHIQWTEENLSSSSALLLWLSFKNYIIIFVYRHFGRCFPYQCHNSHT